MACLATQQSAQTVVWCATASDWDRHDGHKSLLLASFVQTPRFGAEYSLIYMHTGYTEGSSRLQTKSNSESRLNLPSRAPADTVTVGKPLSMEICLCDNYCVRFEHVLESPILCLLPRELETIVCSPEILKQRNRMVTWNKSRKLR